MILKYRLGVNMLWDPIYNMALDAAGANFGLEIFPESHASIIGNWNPNADEAMLYSNLLNRLDMFMLFLVNGKIIDEAVHISDLQSVKEIQPNTPVVANTGVKYETETEVLVESDVCIVGSSLKVKGDTWQLVDLAYAKDFMKIVKNSRGLP